jgi:solute carrier family 6 amino acid transporter-like protein 5/7/9/14
MLILVGLPLLYLEMILGQYGGLSCTKIYARIAPGLKGLGYAMVSIPTMMNIQYVVIMAYALFFLIMGFRSTLPWTYCDGDYNTQYCYSLKQASDECPGLNDTWNQGECITSEIFCESQGVADEWIYDSSLPGRCQSKANESVYVNMTELFPRVSPSEEFWYYRVLNIAVFENGTGELDTSINSWTKWGGPNWEIMGCLALAWTLIFLSLIKGVASYGKVVYFTTLFPYVILTILLGYVATLPGFAKGIEFLFIPSDWLDILDINVWNAAAGQIFYSLGVGVGTQLLLSSYNVFTSNCHRDALLIGLFNSGTSLYAGLVVFGALGYIANEKGPTDGVPADIADVVASGPGLAFIVFPEALSVMEVAPLFSFLFFLMLNLLAISSVCGMTEGILAAILDELPHLKPHRVKILGAFIFCSFLGGLSMCFDSGYLMFSLIDSRVSNAILLLSFIELITISWFYGIDKIILHMEEMGMKLPKAMLWFWWTSWIIVTPILILVVTVLAWANFPGDGVLGYSFPGWVVAMGWGIELLPEAIIVVVGAFTLYKKSKAGESLAFVLVGPQMTANKKWGPRADRPNKTIYVGYVGGENPAYSVTE